MKTNNHLPNSIWTYTEIYPQIRLCNLCHLRLRHLRVLLFQVEDLIIRQNLLRKKHHVARHPLVILQKHFKYKVRRVRPILTFGRIFTLAPSNQRVGNIIETMLFLTEEHFKRHQAANGCLFFE